MTNTNKLKYKILESGYSMKVLAQKLGISRVALSQKIHNKIKFSQEDIKKLDQELNFTSDEIREIFLE